MVPLLLALLAGTPRTMRVEYVHEGDAARGERFTLSRVVLEPLPFPGPPGRPADVTKLGDYLFEVRDPASGKLFYSRGFSSVFAEWAKTARGGRERRAFMESIRFPAPTESFDLVIRKRTSGDIFQSVWSVMVDPRQAADERTHEARTESILEIQRAGPPEQKLDLLLLADGYRAEECRDFEGSARTLTEILFSHEPFKSRRREFNVWAICPPHAEGDPDEARVTDEVFGLERYVVALGERWIRETASHAPYDALAILVNDTRFRAGGIFNQYAIISARSSWADYLFVHELGHALAGLADEYLSSHDSEGPSPVDPVEPWAPNVTMDPAARKWADLITPGVPLPTPWNRPATRGRKIDAKGSGATPRAPDAQAAIPPAPPPRRRTFTRERLSSAFFTRVGAFEGANYQQSGFFRPQLDCVMHSTNAVPFCAVCQRAIGRVIDMYAAPER